METIAAVLITKNEEVMLAQCLDSVVGVDEIIICDTGSTDKTIEIAKKYTDHVYTDYKWDDSFAKARNQAKQYCTSDWILSIDADEVLAKGGLKKIRSALSPKVTAFNVTMQDSKGNSFKFPRVFRNIESIFWKGACHNYLNTQPQGEIDTHITYGYSPAHSADPDRSLKILQKAVEDGEGPREMYYLGREYFYKKRWDEAITTIKQYLDKAHWGPEMAEANLTLARCHWAKKDLMNAQRSCMEALRINANFQEAIVFMSKITGPKNSARWHDLAYTASNDDVLFVRPQNLPKRIDGIESPWAVSPECLKYMEDILLSYKKVDCLEWGAGFSTRYFPKVMENAGIEYTWEAIEHASEWYNKIKDWNIPNVKLHHAKIHSDAYFDTPKGKYDFIFVDGRDRVKCLQKARKLLKPKGYVVLHDAQRERYHEGFEGYEGKFVGDEKPLIWVGQLKGKKK